MASLVADVCRVWESLRSPGGSGPSKILQFRKEYARKVQSNVWNIGRSESFKYPLPMRSWDNIYQITSGLHPGPPPDQA